jgi:hypothetical protein
MAKEVDIQKLQETQDKLIKDIAGMKTLISKDSGKSAAMFKLALDIAKKELKKVEKRISKAA